MTSYKDKYFKLLRELLQQNKPEKPKKNMMGINKRGIDFSFLSMILIIVGIFLIPLMPMPHSIAAVIQFFVLGLSLMFAVLGFYILTNEGGEKHR